MLNCFLHRDGCVTGGRPGLQTRTTLVISVTYPQKPCIQMHTNYSNAYEMHTNRKERYGTMDTSPNKGEYIYQSGWGQGCAL